MAKNTSIIESLELAGGLEAYVQIGISRSTLSFDGHGTGYTVSMTIEELQDYADKIQKALTDLHE